MNVKSWYEIADSTVYVAIKTLEKKAYIAGKVQKDGNMPDKTVSKRLEYLKIAAIQEHIEEEYPFPYFCRPVGQKWLVGKCPKPSVSLEGFTLYENEERKPMNGRKRTIQVKFYVTEEERKQIEEKMKLVPASNMAVYLCKIAIDGYIIQVDHPDIGSSF